MNKYYNLINKAEEESAELYIEGEIVEEGWEREFLEDWFMKATASSEFSEMLKSLNGKPIKIHCNSVGGSLFAGTAMYAALTEYKGKKTGYIGSMCASAATFPMLACDKTYITAASGYCAHLPMTYAYGNRLDFEQVIDQLKQIENVMIDAYQRKTGMGTEKIRNLLEKDEVLSAKQAIEYGFVDGYTEDEPKFDTAFVENMFKRNVAVYNSLKPKYEPIDEPITDETVADQEDLSKTFYENYGRPVDFVESEIEKTEAEITAEKERVKTANMNTYMALLLKRK